MERIEILMRLFLTRNNVGNILQKLKLIMIFRKVDVSSIMSLHFNIIRLRIKVHECQLYNIIHNNILNESCIRLI